MPERVYTNRYEIVRHLAQGGMAEVYLAHDQLLDRRVALKVLFAEFARDPAFVQRFRREAQSAANLSHPNIVAVYDWGEEDGTYFIVMEYVEGRTLKEAIHIDGPLHAGLSADLASDVAGALAFAHRSGVVHRDVKPGNILLTPNGQVKVTDFGIARASGTSEGLTQTGSVIGTATYFSPEQAQGLPVDARSDVYSLGCVLYEMVCGVPPFSGDSPIAVAYKHVREVPPPPSVVNPAVPLPLETIILTALAKNPEDRFPSADDMRGDLARFRRGEPVGPMTAVVVPTRPPAPGAEPTIVGGRVPPPDATRVGTRIAATPTPVAMPRRRKSPWPFAVALAFLLAALVILFLLLNNELSDDGDGAGRIAVPDLIGRTQDQATAILDNEGLEYEIELAENDEYEQGIVFGQTPEPETRVEPDETIELLVSAGKGQVAVPDVTGDAQEDAQQELVDAGFDTFVRNEASDSVSPGSVVRTDPAAGTTVTRGSRVILFVSSGVEMVAVPDVAGKTAVAAASDLTRAGFTPVEVTEPSDEVEEGTVIRTEPGAGGAAPRGSEVQLVISSGEAAVVVPDVEGERENVAKARLEAAGFVVEIERIFDPPNAGKVIVQSPAGGSRAPRGSAVKITVGAVASTTTTTSTSPGAGGSTTTTTACEDPTGVTCPGSLRAPAVPAAAAKQTTS